MIKISCILKINNIYDDIADVDKKIADYINENKELITKLSVSALVSLDLQQNKIPMDYLKV